MDSFDKLSLKKDAGAIGWLLLSGQFFMFAAGTVVTAIAMLMGIEGGLLIGSDVGSFIANIIILGIFWLCRRKEISMPAPTTAHPIKLTALALIGIILFNGMVSSFDFATNRMFSIPMEVGESTSILMNLLLMAVFPAIVEEFAFRKVLFGVMRKHGYGVAAVFSSLMFALIHQNVIQIIFAFGLGLICCKLYERTGKLIYCMIVHFINNAYSILLGAAPLPAEIMTYIEIATGIVGVIVLIACICSKKFNLKRFLNYENTFWAKIGTCFTKISVILLTLFCLSMAVITITI